MALRTPPSWLQNGSHPAENDRLTTQALYSATGIIGASSLAITAQGSPNMTVNAALGWCAILSSTANGGVYVAYNDATTVLTITTANPSLPRIDRIVVTVSDAYYSGASNTVAFQVLAGTPNASPAAPATPSDSISLATIAVAAGATSIGAGNITDTRTSATSAAFLPLTGGTVTGATTFSGALAISGATTLTNTLSSNTSVTAASLIATGGTTTVAPLKLTSGTNLTTPQSGAFEYDGAVAYFTPEGTSAKRGVVAVDHVYYLDTTRSLSNVTTVQNALGVGLTIPAGSYLIEWNCNLRQGSTAHNLTVGWGGTTSPNPAGMTTIYDGTTTKMFFGNYTAVQVLSSTTAANVQISYKGILQESGAGTLFPTIQFSVAPGGTNSIELGQFVTARRISGITSGNVSIGNWA